MNQAALHKKMIEIRVFEETLLRMYDKGFLRGTVHTCIGQEAVAVGLLSHLIAGDSIFSGHRCHGHYLANGGDKKSLF
ncbi:MAG: thiamine pyrophosphate-dependent dehydrogenase E1 component subunit alpha, partial [Legionellales bacterium]|nr:thiamine pyrophosphate-dependent dehydrogenase E1 component subunit alpha [Legionellales bacterium]